jgi:hypothetical protein
MSKVRPTYASAHARLIERVPVLQRRSGGIRPSQSFEPFYPPSRHPSRPRGLLPASCESNSVTGRPVGRNGRLRQSPPVAVRSARQVSNAGPADVIWTLDKEAA